MNGFRLQASGWRRVPASLTLVAALVLLSALPLAAQQRAVTLDAIFDPIAKVDFDGKPPTDLAWITDAQYAWDKRDPDQRRVVEWLKVDARTGRTEPLFDQAALEAALAALPGLNATDAARLAHTRDLVFNKTYSAALLTVGDDLYAVDFAGTRLTRLTSTPGEEELPSFSPDGRVVAFVRGNNLFVVDPATARERALTTDGDLQHYNGKFDWVYQEEIYGRGDFRGYWWSPDSSRVAFLRLDETPVHTFTIVDHLPARQRIEMEDYPKAGDPNPLVKVGVARVDGAAPVWMDTTRYSAGDHLVVKVDWTPDSRQVAFQVQDREQTWLDLLLGDPLTGGTRTVLRETTKAWVNDNGNAVWLKDGTFLWSSERSGFKHLYLYKPDGTEVRQITTGPWEARVVHGVDEKSGVVYFSGTERSSLGLDVYRVKLDGTGLTRLSKAAGTHRATFNRALTFYIDSWSDLVTPTQVRLHRADGAEARVIDANPVKALAGFRLSKPELVQVKTRDGFVMEAMLIKPPDFDPSRTYPVFEHTYSGPAAPQVRNAWGGSTYMWHQFLAAQGMVVWICDNRSATGKGAESVWPVYQNLGELELRDLEDGLAWLKQQPWVDGSRVLLNGWSYGGFMTSYALTHSTSWAAGIAGGSVTDWRNYDSIYTERLMRMPQNNPDGYARSAPRTAAANLHGQLLLLHGTIDDNVHMANTIQFAYDLQKAGKRFELMVYPTSRHAVSDPALVKHLRETMWAFIQKTIVSPAATTKSTSAR